MQRRFSVSTVLLVHGAWQSAACWTEVISILGSLGKRGMAVTLTGLGCDTRHLNPEIRLSTHINDVVAVMDSGAGPFVLVGHSYGGMVVTGACEQRPDKALGTIYVDGFVPRDGQSAQHLLPQAIAETFQSMASEQGDGWRLPAGDFLLDVWGTRDPAHRAKVKQDLSDFTIRCFEEVLHLPVAQTRTKPQGYIASGLKHEYPGRSVFAKFVEEARADGWLLMQVDAGHTCEVEKPHEVALAISAFMDHLGATAR
jgi:pimeloyl-ACP methyl ester carboxylesterase